MKRKEFQYIKIRQNPWNLIQTIQNEQKTNSLLNFRNVSEIKAFYWNLKIIAIKPTATTKPRPKLTI